LLLVITLTKLIDDRKFHWLRIFEKTQTWFKKTLNDPEVCAIQKNVIETMNSKKQDIALDFRSITAMFT
jgi:type VI protein secretion system component Hcp